ncbi:hypothetical protein ACQPUZ_00490 [Clostridium tertium]
MHINTLNAINVLDNLMYRDLIPKSVCVFVDSNNNRVEELAFNKNYGEFITNEILPWVYNNYNVTTESEKTIIGEDNTFDITLVFGPMYHLYKFEDKVRALEEAKRVTKVDGKILVAYLMNEYSVITYGFKENNIKKCIEDGKLDENFHVISEPEDLYDYVRIEDINKINEAAGVKRIKIISVDGPANYMRPILNAMDEETFKTFIDYHLSTCERQDLVGAGAHTLDILIKE